MPIAEAEIDWDGRAGLVEHAGPSGLLQRFVDAVDANGNRTSVTGSARTETYALDALDRLTQATYPNGDAVGYTYDPNGNRATQTVNGVLAANTYDDADHLTSDGSLSYAHDANGNVTQAGTTSFAWDWADRLASATVAGTTTSYDYAGDGVRASKTTAGTATPSLWDRQAGLPLLVQDGTQSYLHAGGVLAGVDGGNAATYPLTDGLGSVRGRTDGAGALVGTADYDAFGAARTTTGASGTFGFVGEQRDAESGLVDLRARQYAPGLGRFLPTDPGFPGGAGWSFLGVSWRCGHR